MTLDGKRLIVEALLCAGCDANNISLTYAIVDIGCDYYEAIEVVGESYAGELAGCRLYGDRLTEVAYRLIESSPELRSEWFGAT